MQVIQNTAFKLPNAVTGDLHEEMRTEGSSLTTLANSLK